MLTESRSRGSSSGHLPTSAIRFIKTHPIKTHGNIINVGIMAEPEALVGDSESSRDTLPPKRLRRSIAPTPESDDEDTGLNMPHHEDGEMKVSRDSGSSAEVSSDSGSSDSNDPVSRKARKWLMRRRQYTQPQNVSANIATTAAITSTTDTVNPFAYAMQFGKFPRPVPRQQPHQQPPELADTGYLWNAVPPKTSQFLDLEAAHVGSDISEGSTGSSEGSLDDEDFIDKKSPPLIHTAEELQMLQKLFPKTFSDKKMLKHSPPSRYPNPLPPRNKPVLVNGIEQFPVWGRGSAPHHPWSSNN